MPDTEAERLFTKGLGALLQGNTLSALSCFEKAIEMENNPVYCSYFAYCIARERGQFNKAISLCAEAIEREPKNSIHYLNLGRIYLLINKKTDAVETFRKGLKHETNEQIIDELNKLGTRKTPVIPFLKRSNPLNKYLGVILKVLRLR
ncbi:MAG: tetratricopeptide repeat protein [Nitrospirota bacterium]|nr:tetratricopeptide repeat protein [Nitrospirota bacterium]MDH5769436.1 tetratricopeptide repeat protein [Nitrospirota bacterium]